MTNERGSRLIFIKNVYFKCVFCWAEIRYLKGSLEKCRLEGVCHMPSGAEIESISRTKIPCEVSESIFSFKELPWKSLLCTTTPTAKDFDNQFPIPLKGLWRTHLNTNHLQEENVILWSIWLGWQFPWLFFCGDVCKRIPDPKLHLLSLAAHVQASYHVASSVMGLGPLIGMLSSFPMVGRKWNYLIANFFLLPIVSWTAFVFIEIRWSFSIYFLWKK